MVATTGEMEKDSQEFEAENIEVHIHSGSS